MKKIVAIMFSSLVLFVVLFILLIIQSKKPVPKPLDNYPLPTKVQVFIPVRRGVVTGTQSQEQADKNFAEELTRLREQYPWYSKLPLTNSNYFVYFDLDKKILIGKIYSLSNNLSDSQIRELKNTISLILSDTGINIKTYPVVWQLE